MTSEVHLEGPWSEIGRTSRDQHGRMIYPDCRVGAVYPMRVRCLPLNITRAVVALIKGGYITRCAVASAMKMLFQNPVVKDIFPIALLACYLRLGSSRAGIS